MIRAVLGPVYASLLVACGGPAQTPPTASGPAVAGAPAADRAALERQLERRLTDVVFVGAWQVTDEAGLAGEALLSPHRPERYSIVSARKFKGEDWQIVARIEYAETDVVLPLQIPIRWAGDTPVITVEALPIPGIGTYTARVMISGNFYCGTWSGDGYGGVMSGQVLSRAAYERLHPGRDEKGEAMSAADADPIELTAGSTLSDHEGRRVMATGTLREQEGEFRLFYKPGLSWPVMLMGHDAVGKQVRVVGRVARETVGGPDGKRGRGERWVIEADSFEVVE